jgi:hypothetical protein
MSNHEGLYKCAKINIKDTHGKGSFKVLQYSFDIEPMCGSYIWHELNQILRLPNLAFY